MGLQNSADNNHAEKKLRLPVQGVLEKLQSELKQSLVERAEVMRQIGTVKKTIIGLASVFGKNLLTDDVQKLVGLRAASRKRGITQACRAVLMAAEGSMTAHDTLSEVQSQDRNLLAGHKNPLASVTTVLNRLVSYGEVQKVTLGKGTRLWKWSSPASSAEGLVRESSNL